MTSLQRIDYPIFSPYPELMAGSLWVSEDDFVRLPGGGNFPRAYRPLLRLAGMNADRAAMAEQVHGTRVAVVEDSGIAPAADGLLTTVPGLPLIIRTADCAAVMIYDIRQRVIAHLHAGWRGVCGGIITRGVEQLREQFGSRPRDLTVAVSPFIHACCYRVGPEFRDFFAPVHLSEREDGLYLDLKKAIHDQLLQSGVPEKQMAISAECTACSPRGLPSYRREKSENRMLHFLMLRPDRAG